MQTKHTRAAGLTLAALSSLAAWPAVALDFDLGDASIRIDSDLSTGFAVRMEYQDRQLIGRANQTASRSSAARYVSSRSVFSLSGYTFSPSRDGPK